MDPAKPSPEKEKCGKECVENDNKLSTISTGKCSTDQLICKTPLDSTPVVQTTPRSVSDQFNERNSTSNAFNNAGLAFALLQIALGIIISVCGFFIYTHNMASGLWSGPVIILTGALGTSIQYNHTKRHLLATWYLILGLVSFALSQLTLVLTAIGLTRLEASLVGIPEPIDRFLQLTVEMEKALTQGLLISVMVATAFECLAAATGVYLQAKESLRLWCCVSGEAKREPSLLGAGDAIGKDTMLRSWLGKLQSPPLTGTVSTNAAATVCMLPTTLPHFKRVNGKQMKKPYIRTVMPNAMVPALVPVHLMMPQQQHQLLNIIPAPPPSYCPQAPIPAYYTTTTAAHPRPTYAPVLLRRHTTAVNHSRRHQQMLMAAAAANAQQHHHHHQLQAQLASQRQLAAEQRQLDIACVYTGLDRDIAEQYIQCCDSRKSEIASNSSAGTT